MLFFFTAMDTQISIFCLHYTTNHTQRLKGMGMFVSKAQDMFYWYLTQ